MVNTKTILTVGLLILAPFIGWSQTVPNGNFENWESAGSYLNPESWITDNAQGHITVSQDTDAYEGDYAMRVTAIPIGSGEHGEAYTFLDINYFPSALNFYAKSSQAMGGPSVEIKFFNANEDEIYTEFWYPADSMEVYTYISIPLTPPITPEDPPPAYARILVSAQVGDFTPGHAWISVDAMTLGVPQSIRESGKEVFDIFPNPASEKITVRSSQNVIGNLKIFDAQGKMVFEKHIRDNSADIDVRTFSPGVYFVGSDNMNIKASTFIVK